jgi:hypothetical protein
MISLHDDFGEPDYEAMAERLTQSTGIQWTAGDLKMWKAAFSVLEPPPAESDEIEH